MTVNVNQRGFARLFVHNVAVPDLLVESFGRHVGFLHRDFSTAAKQVTAASFRAVALRFAIAELSAIGCRLCALRHGRSQAPDSADRKIASITRIFPIASSIGTGTSISSRMARENASPCTVY